MGVLPAGQQLAGVREAAPEHHQHLVVVDPQAAAQLGGAAGRPVGGIVHESIVEGAPAFAA